MLFWDTERVLSVEAISLVTMEAACKCCSILHNLFLNYDEGYHEIAYGWENVDWSTIDPALS